MIRNYYTEAFKGGVVPTISATQLIDGRLKSTTPQSSWKQYRAENPGSKLKTAVTGKVKPGSKAAKRRKSFCARSKGWTGERGKAARRRWKC